ELNRFQMSDDLKELVSYPNQDGSPKSVINGIEFALFNNAEPYAESFNQWLTQAEKHEVVKYLSVYYALCKRVEDMKKTDDNLSFIAMRNLMNKYLRSYFSMLVKKVNARLDDVGLRAQLGKIDITWKTKEEQSSKAKELQEKKQQLLEKVK
ncbi:MAG: hypothetical protein V1647_00800, partial [Pseudomonadota bacterium]